MRIGGQALALNLLAEVVQLFRSQSPFDKCPCVDAGGNVALLINQVPFVMLVRCTEEVVESDFVKSRR